MRNKKNNFKRKEGEMIVSYEKKQKKIVNIDKTYKGRFLTIEKYWITSAVNKFIKQKIQLCNNNIFDPFAGQGHLLKACKLKYKSKISGCDINGYNNFYNDSLIKISLKKESLIVTNPPYLAKYSAKRKGVYKRVKKYFDQGEGDLYKLALVRCMEVAKYIVAIVPETILNSNFDKSKFVLVNILSKNPFTDTENPVCVVCIDTTKTKKDFIIYKDNLKIGSYSKLFTFRKKNNNTYKIMFNQKDGNIALRAVDSSNGKDFIKFHLPKNFFYQRERIKISSRLLTYIFINSIKNEKQKNVLIENANKILKKIRAQTKDVILSPFKGNNIKGARRRRLDYKLARYILEKSLDITFNKKRSNQLSLFDF